MHKRPRGEHQGLWMRRVRCGLSLEQALHAVSPAGAVDHEEHSHGRRYAVWGDDLLGYGQPKKENKWWLDLEEVDGKLTIPSEAGLRGNHKPR